jgi:hypothetical protein
MTAFFGAERSVPTLDAFDLEIKVVSAHRYDRAKKADRHEGNQTGAAGRPPRSILDIILGLMGKSAALD